MPLKASGEPELKGNLDMDKIQYEPTPMKSVAMRANNTRREFFSKRKGGPMVWRNLFFPTEILNALGVKMLTLETYAALFARNSKRTKKALDIAAYKGFAGETCSFLRVLEGSELPPPAFGVSTSHTTHQEFALSGYQRTNAAAHIQASPEARRRFGH